MFTLLQNTTLAKTDKKKFHFDIQKITYILISNCCLMPNEQFFSYILASISYIQGNNDDDVHFVLDQHA
jgi:hypothetical protein